MPEKQPRLLVIWGKYELSFDPSEPESYRRDVPKAESTSSMGGISHWTRLQMRSPHWCEALSVLHDEGFRRAAFAESDPDSHPFFGLTCSASLRVNGQHGEA
jgi:hypothetical protein